MGHTTNGISAPVSIEDVQAVLGNSSNDLGTLIQTGLINKWAKYKPISVSTLGVLTTAQRQAANYGIANIPVWSEGKGDLNKMASFWLLEDGSSTNSPDSGITNMSAFWAYSKPLGGSVSPFRLGDFDGYLHDAEEPLKPLSSTNLYIASNGQLVFNYEHGAQSNYTLTYSDLRVNENDYITLSGYYIGTILCRTNATGTKYAITGPSASDALSMNGIIEVWFPDLTSVNSFLGQNDSATFYVMDFFANGQIGTTSGNHKTFVSNFNSLSANRFIAIHRRQTVTITKRAAKFTISNVGVATYSTETRYVYYTFMITNSESDISHAYHVTLTIYDSNNNEIGSVTLTGNVNGGSSKTFNSSYYITGGVGAENAHHVTIESQINATADSAIIKQSDTYNATVVHHSNDEPPVIDPNV